MSERDWRDFDDQLERAIDALNAEHAPEVDDPELLDLLDTARMVRRLRPPAEPDDGFAERLIGAVVEPGSHLNGSVTATDLRHTRPLRVIQLSERRGRSLALVAAALRTIGVCVLAGMIAGGLIGGLGGRAAMRVSGYMFERSNPGQVAMTSSSEEPVGQLSLSGTWDLVVEMTITNGLMGGLMYLLIAPHLPNRRGIRGAVFALLLLLASGWLVIDSGNTDFSELGNPYLNVAMFGGLIVAFGLAVPWLADRFARVRSTSPRRARRHGARAWGVLTVALGALGLLVMTMLCLGFTLVFAIVLVESVLRVDPLGLVSALATLAVVVLMALRVVSIFSVMRVLDRVRRIPRYQQIVSLLVPLIVLGGGLVTVRSIITILTG